MKKHRLLSSHTRNALLLALGAGFGAVQIQPHEASSRTLVIAFLAASLPVLAMHWSHASKKTAPEVKA